jgi:hypothetical protein
MRSSATLLILISCFFAKLAQSQSNELIIQGVTGKLYLEHTVVAKENWYSVGRLYNVSPKELAPFNHLTLAQPLSIGQTLQIPLNTTNFSQNGVKASGETLVPVIHVTKEKEWMYRISVNYNKVPATSIEKWNNVTPDQIHAGMHLIVGYLKVHTALSALATEMPASPATAAASAPATTAPANATPVVPSTAATPKPTSTSPATPTPTTTVPTPATSTPATSTPATSTTTPPASTTSTQPAAVMPRPAATTPASTTPAQPTTAPATHVAPAQPTGTPATSTPASPAPHFDGGAFRSEYTESSKSASGQAGVFKSTSGWQDGKYYALMNNVTVGAIVKITDATTNKTVYAKILGQLPDMKESAGLAIRMSNAAAAELGETDSRFAVQVSY